MQPDAAANLILAFEHLVIALVIASGTWRIMHKSENRRRLTAKVFVFFLLFWGSGAAMHLLLASSLFATTTASLVLRVFLTPLSGVGWFVLLRWIERRIDSMDGDHAKAFDAGVATERAKHTARPLSSVTAAVNASRVELERVMDNGGRE